MKMRSDNKGLTVKVNLWSLEKYLDNFDSLKASLWIRGQVTNASTKEVKKFKDAGQLVAILGDWNKAQFKKLKATKKTPN